MAFKDIPYVYGGESARKNASCDKLHTCAGFAAKRRGSRILAVADHCALRPARLHPRLDPRLQSEASAPQCDSARRSRPAAQAKARRSAALREEGAAAQMHGARPQFAQRPMRLGRAVRKGRGTRLPAPPPPLLPHARQS
eukprot:6188854-Pleurochrysis_carterae.AAC.4